MASVYSHLTATELFVSGQWIHATDPSHPAMSCLLPGAQEQPSLRSVGIATFPFWTVRQISLRKYSSSAKGSTNGSRGHRREIEFSSLPPATERFLIMALTNTRSDFSLAKSFPEQAHQSLTGNQKENG